MKWCCLGNGESIGSVNIGISSDVPVTYYGCNSIYKRFHVDVLIAVDDAMADEIRRSDYDGYFIHEKSGIGSGATALSIMCAREGCDTVYLIGHDLDGSCSYAEKEIYCGNFEKQLCSVFKVWAQVNFIRVLPETGYIPETFSRIPNLTHITIDEMNMILRGG